MDEYHLIYELDGTCSIYSGSQWSGVASAPDRPTMDSCIQLLDDIDMSDGGAAVPPSPCTDSAVIAQSSDLATQVSGVINSFVLFEVTLLTAFLCIGIFRHLRPLF